MPVSVEKSRMLLRCPITFFGKEIPYRRVEVNSGLPRAGSGFFDRETALTAAVLSFSAAQGTVLAENLYALGYSALTVVGNDGKRDEIGMTIASRERGRYLDVVAVLKGTEGSEWFSNFDVGYGAEHSGFMRAADFAEEKLGDYVFTHAIGLQPRFFITGYSRGGAVANILAKRLCDRYGTDGVCAYTLAAPAVTLSRRQARYCSIFNLVREEDFFVRVPPESWGYTRYGKDIVLHGGDIRERYRALTGEDYIGFLRRGDADELIAVITRLAPNVHAYYRRRRKVNGKRLSLYEFMNGAAQLLSGNSEEAGELFLGAMLSDYGDLMNRMMSGIESAGLPTGSAPPKCRIADSHSPGAYLAGFQ